MTHAHWDAVVLVIAYAAGWGALLATSDDPRYERWGAWMLAFALALTFVFVGGAR